MPNNTFGLGAKVYLFTQTGMQYQQMFTARGFQSSSEARLHFGLDTLQQADSMLIVWPDFKFQLITNIKFNQFYKANYSNASGFFVHEKYFPLAAELFTNITDSSGINYTHKENEFSDFNSEYFIPHKVSTQGPGLAVADVNRDGLQDFFICAAKNSHAQLFLQTPNSKL